MVDVTALGARVASSAVTPLVRRLFVRDGPGAGLVDRPVRISALVSFRGEKRTVTPKDVEKIAGELVRRALTAAGPGEEPVDAAEAAAVKDALARTLARLGEITVEDYEAVGLGPERFARELSAGVPLAPYGLSEGGTLLYERLLRTASLHILNFLTQRSTYVARRQTDQTQQLARLVQAVDVLLERLPSQSAEDAGFEERYADHIAARYGTLTIYGLDAGTREWPLDTAYLSLEATRPRAGRDGLNGLATNPLMCGMLCALHRDRRGFLPQDRKSLYEAALTMLLERRDRERELHGSGGVRLAYATQVQLPQKLAWWLIRNSRAEMDRDEALAIVARALPALSLDGAGEEEVYRALLLRSGLLREPAEDRVDFLHRTFQDYLGARLAVQEMDFDLLVNNADTDEWEDVILLALAHARPREAEHMLRRLTEPATPRGTLLAAAGLRYAAEVAPETRRRVEEGLAAQVPPATKAAARDVAQAGGDLVLSLLPGPDGLDDDTALRVVQTAAQLRSEAALHFLSRFRDHTDSFVGMQLAAAWHTFDRDQYAREILAHLPTQYAVEAHSADDLRALRSLGGWEHIHLRAPYRVEDLTGLIVPERLHLLALDAAHPVEGLSWLTAFPALRSVTVYTDVDPAVARQVPRGVTLHSEPVHPFADRQG